ncbi:MAG: hypothetical protein WC465_00480 [Patescibacteria group bacterium]
MKYLVSAFLFLSSIYCFTILTWSNNGWQFLQPFLIVVLLFYFNTEDDWLPYILALISGLYLDSVGGIFGLYSVIFISLIFILRTLQLTVFTARNMLTVILLVVFSIIIFWLMFWLLNFLFAGYAYVFTWSLLGHIAKGAIANLLIIILGHILYYNFWLKLHERQSF